MNDPLYDALREERFGPPLWWIDEPRPDLTDKRIQRYLRASLDKKPDELEEAI